MGNIYLLLCKKLHKVFHCGDTLCLNNLHWISEHLGFLQFLKYYNDALNIKKNILHILLHTYVGYSGLLHLLLDYLTTTYGENPI